MSDTNQMISEQEQEQETETEEQPTESQQTGQDQETNTSIDKEELEGLRRIVTMQTEQLSRLTNVVADSTRINTPPPVEEPLPDKETDPVGYLEAKFARREAKLMEQLENSIKPLRELSVNSQKKTVYDSATTQLKSKYPNVADEVYDEMWKLGGEHFDPTRPQLIEQGLLYLLGTKAAQGVSTARKAASKEDKEESESFTPPNTPSNMPPRGDFKLPRKLTEADRRLMVTMKMDPKKDVQKYFEYMGRDARTIED